LFLCIFQEHYIRINEALSAIQDAVLIMEQQSKRLIQLRKGLSELHCVQESATADIAEGQEDELPFDVVLEIKISEGLETSFSRSVLSMLL
jgi:hypothetical protein